MKFDKKVYEMPLGLYAPREIGTLPINVDLPDCRNDYGVVPVVTRNRQKRSRPQGQPLVIV